MDIKKIIEELISKLKSDPGAVRGLESDPAGTIKNLTGLDVPADQLNAVVDGIKAKINLDELGDKLGGLGNLFKK